MEGSLTFYNGTFGDTIGQEMAGRFQAQYPRVKAQIVRSTAQVVYQRLLQDRASGMRNCDVFSSSDISHFDTLRKEKRLLDWTPGNASEIYPAFKELYVPGQYYPALISMMALAYNTNRVTAAEAPRRWTDLLDAKWKGKAAVGHPGFSGYAGTWAVLMTQMYGEGFIDKLAANNPLVGRSSNDSVTQLNSGERSVAAVPAYVAFESAGRGQPDQGGVSGGWGVADGVADRGDGGCGAPGGGQAVPGVVPGGGLLEAAGGAGGGADLDDARCRRGPGRSRSTG